MIIIFIAFLVGSVWGYFTCCLMTVSKIESIREEANEYIRKNYEEKHNNV